MKVDQAITQPGTGATSNVEYMNELARWLAEENAGPPSFAEQLLEERRFEKVMRMTATAFGKLSDVERRNYARWAKHLARVFAEKAAQFERNSKPEPEAPAFLRAEG